MTTAWQKLHLKVKTKEPRIHSKKLNCMKH